MDSLVLTSAKLVQCAAFSASASCFFQRDFKMKEHGFVVLVLLLAGTSSTGWLSVGTLAFAQGEVVVAGIHKNLLMATILFLSAAVERFADPGRGAWAAITLVAATFQLIRRPADLKNRLRDVRVGTGPLYVLACYKTLSLHPQTWLRYVAHFGSISVLAAGVLLRPDNEGLLSALEGLVSLPSPRCRRLWHGLLMMASLVCVIVLLLCDASVGRGRLEEIVRVAVLCLGMLLILIEVVRRLT